MSVSVVISLKPVATVAPLQSTSTTDSSDGYDVPWDLSRAAQLLHTTKLKPGLVTTTDQGCSSSSSLLPGKRSFQTAYNDRCSSTSSLAAPTRQAVRTSPRVPARKGQKPCATNSLLPSHKNPRPVFVASHRSTASHKTQEKLTEMGNNLAQKQLPDGLQLVPGDGCHAINSLTKAQYLKTLQKRPPCGVQAHRLSMRNKAQELGSKSIGRYPNAALVQRPPTFKTPLTIARETYEVISQQSAPCGEPRSSAVMSPLLFLQHKKTIALNDSEACFPEETSCSNGNLCCNQKTNTDETCSDLFEQQAVWEQRGPESDSRCAEEYDEPWEFRAKQRHLLGIAFGNADEHIESVALRSSGRLSLLLQERTPVIDTNGSVVLTESTLSVSSGSVQLSPSKQQRNANRSTVGSNISEKLKLFGGTLIRSKSSRKSGSEKKVPRRITKNGSNADDTDDISLNHNAQTEVVYDEPWDNKLTAVNIIDALKNIGAVSDESNSERLMGSLSSQNQQLNRSENTVSNGTDSGHPSPNSSTLSSSAKSSMCSCGEIFEMSCEARSSSAGFNQHETNVSRPASFSNESPSSLRCCYNGNQPSCSLMPVVASRNSSSLPRHLCSIHRSTVFSTETCTENINSKCSNTNCHLTVSAAASVCSVGPVSPRMPLFETAFCARSPPQLSALNEYAEVPTEAEEERLRLNGDFCHSSLTSLEEEARERRIQELCLAEDVEKVLRSSPRPSLASKAQSANTRKAVDCNGVSRKDVELGRALISGSCPKKVESKNCITVGASNNNNQRHSKLSSLIPCSVSSPRVKTKPELAKNSKCSSTDLPGSPKALHFVPSKHTTTALSSPRSKSSSIHCRTLKSASGQAAQLCNDIENRTLSSPKATSVHEGQNIDEENEAEDSQYDEPWEFSCKSKWQAALPIMKESQSLPVPPVTNDSSLPKKLSRDKLSLNFGCGGLNTLSEKVDSTVTIARQPWYHAAISRIEAEHRLSRSKEGSYLVRQCESNRAEYALSLKSARGFMHMKIQQSKEKQWILGYFSQPFSDISQMISYYTVNKLPIRGAEHMCLLHPVVDQLL